MIRRSRLVLVSALVLSLVAAGCGDDDDTEAGATTTAAEATTSTAPAGDATSTTGAADGADTDAAGYTTLRVPDDYPTIQAAVDEAQPGDLVLIGPGTYNEAVVVETDDIVIRGVDRNTVVLDGQHADDMQNGFIVFSDGVAIENLTTTGYQSNGVFFTGDYDADIVLAGYRASYVTAYNNGDYGIYAFNAAGGLIENSYGSGHPDSGFYIGQCQPCDAVVRNVVSEYNALGYSGTNSGGNLYVIDSEFANNRVGVVPNTLDSEELAPQRDTVFAGNYVHDNANADTPRKGAEWDLAFGGGIVLAGGNDNLVTRNLVADNPYAGIAVAWFADQNVWPAERNTIVDNTVSGSEYDLYLLVTDPAQGAAGNCFEGNRFTTQIPNDIETVAACGAGTEPLAEQYLRPLEELPVSDYRTMPVPPPQESMPDAETAPPVPASATPPPVDLESIETPTP